jgi:Cu(I)/Ag(I) efflux system membrane fusion protein
MSTTRGTCIGTLGTVLLTTAVIAAFLWLQQRRAGWPFADVTTANAATATAGGADAAAAGRHGPSRTVIEVAAGTQEALGVRVETVGREALTQTIPTVATVVPDESRIAHVHTRVAGWIEQLDVNTTGELVRAGQPIARVFSQELLSSQTEYLAARRAMSATGLTSAVVAGGRTRLGVLGMTDAEIEAIERAGEPRRLITVVAPRGGVIVNRGITVGTAVDPSTPLLTIADLSRVWVFAEVPEASIPAVRVGATARLDFPASGRPPFDARVDFVYPTLTDRTRTLRVRFTVGNPAGTLRPGLFGSATFQSAGAPVITVPRDAVVDTGREQHVFVASGGRFEPRPVTLGVQLPDRVEVRSGLSPGEAVVVAGVFLLDSESRLRATGGAGGHGHGHAPAPEAARAPAASGRPATDPHAGH